MFSLSGMQAVLKVYTLNTVERFNTVFGYRKLAFITLMQQSHGD